MSYKEQVSALSDSSSSKSHIARLINEQKPIDIHDIMGESKPNT